MTAQTTAMADQALAIIAEVERRCGANSHLIEDSDLGALVLFALDARPSIEEITNEIQFGGRAMANRPRIVRRRSNRPSCDRCLNDWDGQDGKTLDLPAGCSIIRVNCCPSCVAFLDDQFRPVHWNE